MASLKPWVIGVQVSSSHSSHAMVFFGGLPVSGLVTPISSDGVVNSATAAFAASTPLPPDAAALVAAPPPLDVALAAASSSR